MFECRLATTVKFEIKSTQQSDGGQYVCAAKNKYGLSESETVQVEILGIPFQSDVDVGSAAPKSYVGDENQARMEIHCFAQSKSKAHQSQIKWYFNGTQIDIDNISYMVRIQLTYRVHSTNSLILDCETDFWAKFNHFESSKSTRRTI